MAYVEVWKNERLITRRRVDEQKARTGCRIRLGSLGQVRLAIGQSEKLGEFEFRMLEGEPPPIPQELKATASILPQDAQASPALYKEAHAPASPDASGGSESALHTGQVDSYPDIEGYKIIERLGEGGMGVVWRAEQISTKRQVALKLMTAHRAVSPKAQARFQREVELTARLDHPNIARIYESGLHRGMYYYAMELIDGVPLDQYVRSKALTQIQILKLMHTVCQAVLYAHLRAVIHRDLKPSNILVTPDGQPHILDFGLAKALLEEDEALTVSIEGQITGTPAYMSPEQAAGRHAQIDTRTDVFSLGVILYELLVGQSPHDLTGSMFDVIGRITEGKIRRPSELNKSIDSELEAILLKALALNPEQRYASAGTLAIDINNYLTEEPLDARVPTAFYFIRKKAWKYRVQVGIALAVLAVLLFTYTRIIARRAELKATEKALETQIGKADLAEQKAKWAELELKVLGKNEQQARDALRALQDEYFAAQKRADKLQQDLDQRIYLLSTIKKVQGRASSPLAGFTFGQPVNLGPVVNSAYYDGSPRLSADGLELYFYSDRPGGYGRGDSWVTKRATIHDPWENPVNLGPQVNIAAGSDKPTAISHDGLELYLTDYEHQRPGGRGGSDIWVARRTKIDDPWGLPRNLGPPVNTPDHEANVSISSDGLTLYFDSNRTGGFGDFDIWVTTRATKQSPWREPVNLGPTVNSTTYDAEPFISNDGLVLLFDSSRSAGGYGGYDLYIANRTTTDQPWLEPVNLGPTVNSGGPEEYPAISPDRSTLFFEAERPGGFGDRDLWQAPIIPVVDFNGDGKVDITDLKILVECWGQNVPSLDVAPAPFGDGVVDVKDLEVLMIYWGQEVQNPAPTAQ